MGSTNPQIKNFISIAYDYRRSRTDKNLVQLQRHLQILSVVNDLSIFEPTGVETLEFYVCLEQFLNSNDAKSPVVWKVISLLAHICSSPTIRVALRDDIKLVPILSDFLVESKLNKDKSLKTLNLIKKISYKLKALVQKLTDMKTATINLKLLASELMFYLDLRLTDLDFGLIEHIVDLVFTAATEGFMENNITCLQLASDVFGELTSCPSIEEHLKGYKNYSSYLQPFLDNMGAESPESLIEVLLDLFSHLIELDHTQIQPLYKDLFSKVMSWMHSGQCGVAAVKLIQALISVDQDSLSSDRIENFISTITVSLNFGKDFNLSQNRLYHINALLTLLEGLCTRDSAYRLILGDMLQPSVFSSLLMKITSIDAPCALSGNTLVQSFYSDYESNSSRYCGCSRSQDDVSSLSINDMNASFKESMAQSVVLILTVVKLLGSKNAEFMLVYSEMINNAALMTYVVRCERSTVPDFVARAVIIISEGSVPNTSMGSLVKALEEANACTHPSLNLNLGGPNVRLPGSRSHPQLFSPGCEASVDSMIERLGGTVDKMEIKDCALTDIMEMYEYKLAAMAHVERSLQNALTAADVQNRQSHHSMLQTRVQVSKRIFDGYFTVNDHLRSLLCSWEERLQIAQKEKAEVQASISQIQSSARQHRENFRKEKTDMERHNLNQKKEISSLRDHLDNREEAIRRLQRQLNDAHNESKNLNKQVKEEQEKYQRSQDQNQKLEEELKKGRREYDDLQKENQRVEKLQIQQKKENSELEMLIHSHEETMSAKESELEEMTRKYNELKRIQDMIHNISAGKLGF
ncbi:CIP2A-like [Homarus americanus]|uniref:CIP2A-like n=1 Tax=Homarus americanus TaxID=6706 RepID=A0A8J5MTQ0_HOMAM|nr:CIP2A-like [Homarus americanus]